MNNKFQVFIKNYAPYVIFSALLLLISANWLNKSYFTSPSFLKKSLEKNLSEEIKKVNTEATLIMMNSREEKIFSVLRDEITKSFFLYKNEKLMYWSDHTFMPEYYLLTSHKSRSLLQLQNGSYLLLKYKFNDEYELFGLIELSVKRPISNDYLTSGYNTDIFPVSEGIDIFEVTESEGELIKYLDSELFKVKFNNAVHVKSESVGFIIVILYFILFYFTSIYVWNRLNIKVKEGNFEPALYIWITYLVALRYLMFLFDFPDGIVETGLFGSLFFASSSINPSLGDMLINVLLVNAVFLFVFLNYTHSRLIKKILASTHAQRWFFSIIMLMLSIFMLSYPHLLFQTIYRNSQVSFDITKSINISFPKIIGFVVFLISSFTVFLGFQVFFRVSYHLNKDHFIRYCIMLLVSGLILFLIQYFSGAHLILAIVTGIVIAIVLYKTRIFKNFHHWRYNSFLYIFTIISVVAFLGAYGVYEFENERETVNKERFADYFLIKNDNLTEYYLNEVNKRIREDMFISSRLASPFLSKDVIEDKIRQVHLNTLFDKYDISIGIYKEDIKYLAGDSIGGISLLLNGKSIDNYSTEYEGIYFLDRVDGEVGKRYVDKIEIIRRDLTVGFVILDLKLKKVIPNDVYFELLVDNRFTQPWFGKNYNYAIFNNGKIIYNSGEFNYKGNFPLSKLSSIQNGAVSTGTYNGYKHIGLKDNEGRVIVVSSPVYSTMDIATNFCFFLIIQIGILLTIASIIAVFKVYKRVNINYSTKIQLYFNLAFFIPMLIVSFVTLSAINKMFREEVTYEYSLRARNITENISSLLDNYLAGNLDRDQLMNKLLEISRYTDTDINLFNRFGELLATSRPLIYDNNLLAKYLSPGAYSRIIEQNINQWLAAENVGKLNYNTSYFSIRSFRTGNLIGVLSIPFFESEEQLDNQQVEVLSSILTIFTIVFVSFLLLSYFVSKGLTFPLLLITKKLKRTSLNQVNEPLDWTSDDEIGMMIGEYNQMLANLEENKEALARSQKEMVWREMAQQVAHEIKNPLTPMKLTLQHLERKLSGNALLESRKPISNLLHHIDTLDDIATSFSSFARMPIPENKPFEIIKVLKGAIDLHKNMENVSIIKDFDVEECMVYGDEKLMGRIISNIILNAVQAKREEENPSVKFALELKKKTLIIEISDNGKGIDPEIGSKIFVPNFTTKEKGSGIGLSIAKHGIEHAGGKIWYESELGVGTTFFIELQRFLPG